VRCMQCTLMLRFPTVNCNFSRLVRWEGRHDALLLALWVRYTPSCKESLKLSPGPGTLDRVGCSAQKRQVKSTCGAKRRYSGGRLLPRNPSDSKHPQSTPYPLVDVYVLDGEGTGDCAVSKWTLLMSNASGRLLILEVLRIGLVIIIVHSQFL
jgi:hypothetical protein